MVDADAIPTGTTSAGMKKGVTSANFSFGKNRPESWSLSYLFALFSGFAVLPLSTYMLRFGPVDLSLFFFFFIFLLYSHLVSLPRFWLSLQARTSLVSLLPSHFFCFLPLACSAFLPLLAQYQRDLMSSALNRFLHLASWQEGHAGSKGTRKKA
jgi:hypothetical protein